MYTDHTVVSGNVEGGCGNFSDEPKEWWYPLVGRGLYRATFQNARRSITGETLHEKKKRLRDVVHRVGRASAYFDARAGFKGTRC